jgi:hypothetical protein
VDWRWWKDGSCFICSCKVTQLYISPNPSGSKFLSQLGYQQVQINLLNFVIMDVLISCYKNSKSVDV